MAPTKGDPAPDFTLPRTDGTPVTLSGQRPAPVVLYFYPRDDTPGCTVEANGFSGLAGAFAEAGVRVFGISKDSIESHTDFAAKHGLEVALLSDEGSDVCERYGVWGELDLGDRTIMGVARTTFLIGPEGRIAEVWDKVEVEGHAEAVLAAAREL